MWLKKYLEAAFELPVIVSEKTKYGDYSTTLLLVHKLDEKAVVEVLLDHPLVDTVKIMNGHVNIRLTDQLLTHTGPLAEKPVRIVGLHDLMASEGKTSGKIRDEWLQLTKKVNELNHSLDAYNDAFELDQKSLSMFKTIDEAYIYRLHEDDYIGGIYRVLHQLLIALGRINND